MIAPARAVNGSVALPGDKSISHRYAMLAAIAEGASEIANYAAAADCQSTLGCLQRVGAGVAKSPNTVRITGNGLRGLRHSWRDLDAGNSGTTIRLLSGILAGQSFRSTITGDNSLRKRPMRRVIEPLSAMGAQILAEPGGRAPLKIHGQALHGIEYALPAASAQVKSAMLVRRAIS